MKITKTDWSNPDEKVMLITIKGRHLRNHKIVKTSQRFWANRIVEMDGHIFYHGCRVKWNKNPRHGRTGAWMGWGRERLICTESSIEKFDSYQREWI